MDRLTEFLFRAQWRKLGQHTSICDDENLKSALGEFASSLPASLKGYELQAWKVTGGLTKVVRTAAYLIPVHIIEGTPKVTNEPNAEDPKAIAEDPKAIELVPGSEKFYFIEDEATIMGALYYILAYPPGS